jgi:hypothetical protein
MSGDTTFLYVSLIFNLLFAIISLLKSIRKCKTYCCEYTTNGEGEESPSRFNSIAKAVIQKITPRPQNSSPTSSHCDGGRSPRATLPPRATREAPTDSVV